MQVNAYLNFNGNCEAAFKFYEQCFGGKILTLMRHEGTAAAEHVPAEWRSKILHARLAIGDTVLMASDAPPGHYEQPKGFSISLQLDKPAEAERVFHALTEKGSVRMPIGETFFAVRFGMVVDRFGIPWMVLCEKAS